jgi:hypothetical protein
MIGLFHSDWLGCWPGSVSNWPRAGGGRDRKIQQTPQPYRGELRVDLEEFLDSTQAELSRDTPPPPSCAIAPLFSRSRTDYFKCLCVTYTNITSL